MATPKVDFAAMLGHLADVEYPATKEDLVEAAQAGGAGEAEVRWLDSLPDRSYESSADVMGEAGAEEGSDDKEDDEADSDEEEEGEAS